MSSLDKLAISVILIVLLLLSGVIYIGNQKPVDIICKNPKDCAQISPLGAVTFEFSRPVRQDLVENLWQTVPDIEGKWEWLDDQNTRWSANKPIFFTKTITFQFKSGEMGVYGEKSNELFQWEARVRSPQVLGVGKTVNGSEIFAVDLESGSGKTQLTRTDGRIIDYDVSSDGEFIFFSVVNELKGIEIWQVQRDGSNQRNLLDCGSDRGTTPACSPNTNEIAYTRESAGVDPNGPKGAPRIWLLELDSALTIPLFNDAQELGHGPAWSPDGQWISIWDGLNGGIKVANRKTGEKFMLESSNGDTGCWSPNADSLYYSNMVLGNTGVHSILLKADVRNRSTMTIMDTGIDGKEVSITNPTCNPVEEWIAVTIQSNMKNPSKELYVIQPGLGDGISIMQDLSRIVGSFSWTLDGNQLVFQLEQVGSAEAEVEIWAWDRSSGKARRVTSGYRFPKLLP